MSGKPRWFEILPGWVPICITILCAAFVLGQKVQSFEDRLTTLEGTVTEMKEYLKAHPLSANDPPPISQTKAPLQSAETN